MKEVSELLDKMLATAEKRVAEMDVKTRANFDKLQTVRLEQDLQSAADKLARTKSEFVDGYTALMEAIVSNPYEAFKVIMHDIGKMTEDSRFDALFKVALVYDGLSDVCSNTEAANEIVKGILAFLWRVNPEFMNDKIDSMNEQLYEDVESMNNDILSVCKDESFEHGKKWLQTTQQKNKKKKQ